VAIGLVNTLPEGESVEFWQPVAVVAHGGTHEARVEQRDGMLYVSPGSPTLADVVSVGVVELSEGPPLAVIVRL
jgi:predicted phosphodiesterase